MNQGAPGNRTLAVDVGTVRLGLALSDSLGVIAQALPYVRAEPRKQALAEIARLCQDKGVVRLVVGLPKAKSGGECPATLMAREFAAALGKATGLPVLYVDERLSTRQAERVLLEADVSRRKRREAIDSMAATVVLQSFLDRQAPGPDGA